MARIFLRKNRSIDLFQNRGGRGFTLLEIVIVVVLLAFVATLAIPRLGGDKAKIQAMVRKIAVLARDIKYRAKLHNATYRLVIEMAPKEDDGSEKDPDQFWVEKAPGTVLLSSEEESEKEKEAEDDEDRPPDPNGFALDPRLMKKPEQLPKGMRFDRVEFANEDEPINEGVAYIYFLPQGFISETAIHLQYAEKSKWTIAIQPLTGRADIFDEDISLEELRE